MNTRSSLPKQVKTLIGLLVLILLPLGAMAEGSELEDLAQERKDIEKQLKENKSQIAKNNKLLARVKSGRIDDEELPEGVGECTEACRAHALGCSEAFLKTLFRVSNDQPLDLDALAVRSKKSICMTVFLAAQKNVSKLPEVGCQQSVLQCREVAIKVFEQNLLADTRERKQHSEELIERKAELIVEIRDAERNSPCPYCGTSASTSAASSIFGEIQAITPMGAGGSSAYLYGGGFDSGAANYSVGINQCLTIGVPCSSPAFVGGNYGPYSYNPYASGYNPYAYSYNPYVNAGLALSLNPGGAYNPYANAALSLSMNPSSMYNPYAYNQYAYNPYANAALNLSMNPSSMYNPYAYNQYAYNPYANAALSLNMNPSSMYNPYAYNSLNPYLNWNRGSVDSGFNPHANGAQYQMMWQAQAQAQAQAQQYQQYQYQQYRYQQYQYQQYQYQQYRYQQYQQNVSVAKQQLYQAQAQYNQVVQQGYAMWGGGMNGGWGTGWGGGFGVGVSIGLGVGQ